MGAYIFILRISGIVVPHLPGKNNKAQLEKKLYINYSFIYYLWNNNGNNTALLYPVPLI